MSSLSRIGLATCAACVAGCAGPREPTQRPEFAPPTGVFQSPLAIVTTTDDDLLPSLAPVGNQIAYAANSGGNLDVFARDLGGGAARRLTTHSTDDSDPAFDPKGEKIAWVSQADDVKGDIWVMDTDGDDKRRLTDRATADRAPAWSADGRRIFFGSRAQGEGERIDSIELSSGVRKTVVESGWDPEPVPDGKTLLYVALDDIGQPRIYALNMASGATAALTDGMHPEGFPRTTVVGGTTHVVFTRFTDDTTGDGIVDALDPSSLWAIELQADLFEGSAPPSARPLTAAEGSEIFAAPFGNWLVYTTRGFSDLDIYALPIGGMIDATAGAEAVLQAARNEERPALRSLALRYIVATTPSLEAQARYELARGLAERDRLSDARTELNHVITLAGGSDLSGLAEIEIERLKMLERLEGRLLVRRQDDRAAVGERIAAVDAIMSRYPEAEAVAVRARTFRAEANYALGIREAAVSAFEEVAAAPDAPAEDAARSLLRLCEVYRDLGSIEGMERVTVAIVTRFASERMAARRASDLWVAQAKQSATVAPLALLEDIARRYAEYPLIAARAAAAQAELLTAKNREETAQDLWHWISEQFGTERAVLARALMNLGDMAARRGQRQAALDAWERVVAEFSDDSQLRARARRGITRIALLDAEQQERRARRERTAAGRIERQKKARATYGRLIRNNPELVIAHRRYISLSALLGLLPEVLADYEQRAQQQPRDKIARYGYGYALTFVSPLPLDDARREIEAALDLDPRMPAAHLTMGWIRQQLEDRERGKEWLEKSIDSFDATIDLLQPSDDARTAGPDASIWAAALLNKGNSLFQLGKTDLAFATYLERELSGVPFDDPLTESLFQESFARIALSEVKHDVAYDMARLAYKNTDRRKAAVGALLAAIHLVTNSYEDARQQYEDARKLYEERGDWARLVPMLRGRGLAEQALGRYDDALATFAEVLAILARGQGPTQLEHPTIVSTRGLLTFVTELPANPKNVTRAKYGFSGAQEREIASSISARILSRWNDSDEAADFQRRRLALLRTEALDPKQGPRIQLELLYALNEAALVFARGGNPAEAATYWDEALTIATATERFDELATALESLTHVHLRNPGAVTPQIRAHMSDAAEAAYATLVENEDPRQARFAGWLSLHHLDQALRPVPPPPPEVTNRLAALLDGLDVAAEHAQTAVLFAHQADRPKLTAHLQAFAGPPVDSGMPTAQGAPPAPAKPTGAATPEASAEPTAGEATDGTTSETAAGDAAEAPAPAEPIQPGETKEALATESPEPTAPPDASAAMGWREAFDRWLWNADEDGDEWLARAEHAVGSSRVPPQGPEWQAFVATRTDERIAADDVEGAWRLLERARLMELRPPRSRLDGPLGDAWDALRAGSANAKEYEAAVAKAPAVLKALEGRPVDLQDVRASLEGNALLVQVFAPLPDRWHWFVIGPELLEHTVSSALPTKLSSAVVQALVAAGENIETVYWDGGELFSQAPASLPGITGTLGDSYEVVETPSATWLVAARDARNLSHDGTVAITVDATDDSAQHARQEPHDDALPSLAGIAGTGRRVVSLELPRRVVAAPRAGDTQVVFSTAPGAPRMDLDRVAAEPLDATVVVVSPPAKTPAERRALTQALVLAGVPSVIFAASPEATRTSLSERLATQRVSGISPGEGTWRVAGYRGMSPADRVAFAVDSYARHEGTAVRAYKQAFRSQSPADWQAARTAFESALPLLELLDAPDERERLTASGDPKLLKFEKLIGPKLGLLRPLLGQAYQGLRDFERAAALLEVIIKDQEAAGQKKKVADLLLDLGKTHANAKQPEPAAVAFERCASLADELDDVVLASDCKSRLGSMKRELFDHEGAIRSYQEAILGYAKVGSPLQMYPRRYLGFLYEGTLNDYARALEQFEAALRIAEKHELKDQIPVLHVDVARIHRTRGDYQRALTEIARARAAAKGGSPAQRSEVELEAARIYWYRGNYRRALSRQTESLELARAARSTYLEIQARSLEGLIALNQGELETAELRMGDALALSRITKRKSEEAAQLNNLGLILQESGRIDEAIDMYRKALAIDEALGSTEGRAYSLRSLGVAHFERKEYDEALSMMNESLELSRSIGASYNELRGLFHRGEILDAMQSAEAAQSFKEATTLAREISVPEFEWQSLYALGRIAERAGDADAARKRLDEALAVAERLGRGRSSREKQFGRSALYTDAIRLALAAEDVAGAFAYVERARARALMDVLATSQVELPNAEASKLLAGELRAREKRDRAYRDTQLGREGAQERLEAAQLGHKEAKRTLMTSYPRLGRALTIDPVSAAELQHYLPSGVTVVTYHLAATAIYVVLVGREKVEARVVEVPRSEVEALVARTRRKMLAFAPVGEELKRLAAHLVTPVWDTIRASETVVFVPDGPLYHAPFSALPVDGAALIDERVVVVTPSASMLADRLQGAGPERPKHVVAFAPADDLPYARLEATVVGNGGVVTGGDATLERLRAVRADAVDIAAHGVLDPTDPLGSALQFARGADDNGRLELREVFGLERVPQLVTLSACETAGSLVSGDEWLGLGAAFLTAGSNAVVVSQSRVSDLTAAVTMKRFYREVRTKPVGEAMRAAALWTRTLYEHPAHWASFVAMGDFR